MEFPEDTERWFRSTGPIIRVNIILGGSSIYVGLLIGGCRPRVQRERMPLMLKEAIANFIATGEGDFSSLALRAFAWQFERIPPIRQLCESRGLSPENLQTWEDIPLVPTMAFKTQRLEAEPAQEVFASSGTGDQGRSIHYHPYPDLYRQVIEASFPGSCLPPGQRRIPMLSLIPSREVAPDSSLSFMVDHVINQWAEGEAAWGLGPRGIHFPTCRSWLSRSQRSRSPVLILATSFALVNLLEKIENFSLRFRLPPGSRLFETGGYKGKSRELDREELLRRLEFSFGLSPASVIREYGMTELTSQCYTLPSVGQNSSTFVTPPWMRCRILSPTTLAPVPLGEKGLVSFLDLANMGSAIHLLTEDLGQPIHQGFRLVGRAPDAELRGCSLTAEAMTVESEGDRDD